MYAICPCNRQFQKAATLASYNIQQENKTNFFGVHACTSSALVSESGQEFLVDITALKASQNTLLGAVFSSSRYRQIVASDDS